MVTLKVGSRSIAMRYRDGEDSSFGAVGMGTVPKYFDYGNVSIPTAAGGESEPSG